MEICAWCNRGITLSSIGSKGKTFCSVSCLKAFNQNRIERAAEGIKDACDFKDWSKHDLSEIFWIHLGRYVNHPNKHSLSLMRSALSWANHDDHGLSNSFRHALAWAKIDIWKEAPIDES